MVSTRAKDCFKFIKSVSSFTDDQVQVSDWDSDFLSWIILDVQPNGGPYRGGKFKFKVKIGRDFPRKPPRLTCLTEIYHPNIDHTSQSNNVCLSLFDEWESGFGLSDCVQGILFLFYNPNESDPLSPYFTGESEEDFYQNVRLSLTGREVDDFVGPRFIEDDEEIEKILAENARKKLEEEEAIKKTADTQPGESSAETTDSPAETTNSPAETTNSPVETSGDTSVSVISPEPSDQTEDSKETVFSSSDGDQKTIKDCGMSTDVTDGQSSSYDVARPQEIPDCKDVVETGDKSHTQGQLSTEKIPETEDAFIKDNINEADIVLEMSTAIISDTSVYTEELNSYTDNGAMRKAISPSDSEHVPCEKALDISILTPILDPAPNPQNDFNENDPECECENPESSVFNEKYGTQEKDTNSIEQTIQANNINESNIIASCSGITVDADETVGNNSTHMDCTETQQSANNRDGIESTCVSAIEDVSTDSDKCVDVPSETTHINAKIIDRLPQNTDSHPQNPVSECGRVEVQNKTEKLEVQEDSAEEPVSVEEPSNNVVREVGNCDNVSLDASDISESVDIGSNEQINNSNIVRCESETNPPEDLNENKYNNNSPSASSPVTTANEGSGVEGEVDCSGAPSQNQENNNADLTGANQAARNNLSEEEEKNAQNLETTAEMSPELDMDAMIMKVEEMMTLDEDYDRQSRCSDSSNEDYYEEDEENEEEQREVNENEEGTSVDPPICSSFDDKSTQTPANSRDANYGYFLTQFKTFAHVAPDYDNTLMFIGATVLYTLRRFCCSSKMYGITRSGFYTLFRSCRDTLMIQRHPTLIQRRPGNSFLLGRIPVLIDRWRHLF